MVRKPVLLTTRYESPDSRIHHFTDHFFDLLNIMLEYLNPLVAIIQFVFGVLT